MLNLRHLTILLWLIVLCAPFSVSAQQVKYLTHTIQEGDNVNTLSKKYNVSTELLIRLNPELKKEPALNAIIIVPYNDEDYVLDVPSQEEPEADPEEPMIIAYDSIFHKVQPRETLYSLSIKYKMRISRVYELNPHVVSGLKIGQTVLFIKPIYDEVAPFTRPSKYNRHVVRKKETLWRISKMYNTHIDTIKKYNPSIVHQGLKINDTLKIPNLQYNIITKETIVRQTKRPTLPNTTDAEIPTPTRTLTYKPLSANDSVNIRGFRDLRHYPHWYRVLPGESLPSISAKLQIPLVDLLNFNPRLAHTGLDAGTILYYKTFDLLKKVDTLNNEKFQLDSQIPDLEWKLTPMISPDRVPLNKKARPLKVAIMLPFFAQVNDTLLNPSRLGTKDDVKPTIHRLSKPSLHFLYGALYAIDQFKQAGHKFDIRVFDTKNNVNVIEQFIYQESLYSYDLIIGPLTTKSTLFLSNRMKSFNIPIISPFTTKLSKSPIKNLIQSSVSDQAYEKYLIDYLKKVVYNENIVLYTSVKMQEEAKRFRRRLQASLDPTYSKQYDVKVFVNNSEIYSVKDQILDYLSFDRRNLNIIFDKSNSILNHLIINNLSYKSDSTSNLFISNFKDVESFENKVDEIDYLPRNASRIFTSKYTQYHLPETKEFLQHISSSYNLIPDQFSIMGYDLTYDMFNTLLQEGNFFDNLVRNRRFGIGNMFDYRRDEDGFIQNKGMFLLKYNGMFSLKADLKPQQTFTPPTPEQTFRQQIQQNQDTETVPQDKPKEEEEEDNVFNIFDVF